MSYRHGFKIDRMPGMDRATVTGFDYTATRIRAVCVQDTGKGPAVVEGSVVEWRPPCPRATTDEAFRKIRGAIEPHIESYLVEFMPSLLVVADGRGLVTDAVHHRDLRLREVIAALMWSRAFAGQADAIAACEGAGIVVPDAHRIAFGAALCLTRGRVHKFAGVGETLS